MDAEPPRTAPKRHRHPPLPTNLLQAAAVSAAAAAVAANAASTAASTASPDATDDECEPRARRLSQTSASSTPSQTISPTIMDTLVHLMHRVSQAAGLPDSSETPPAPRSGDLTLHWLVDALERVDVQLTRHRLSRDDPALAGMLPRRRSRPGASSFVLRDDDDLTVDGLDGLEDCKVDSEDDVLEPDQLPGHIPVPRRSSAKRSRLIPRGRSAATYLNLPPLPDFPLEEDGIPFSARSSQAHLDARPPFRLPIGSAANSYLTQMSSWKSLGYGETNKLHADYSKIFRREDETPLAPGESSIAIAGGDLFNPNPISERWNIAQKIGEGGYSTVHLATSKAPGPGHYRRENTFAAVKIISKARPELYNDKMVSREVFSFRLLYMAGGHDNIVELYEVCEDEDNVYLVMELLAGGELFARISERGQYTERDAANLVVSMLASLACCHRLNLTHRDVKPENFVFCELDGDDADVKLTDFGIAHYSEDPSALCKTLCGTPLYVAPEVLLRQPYGPEADLWSLGVIVYIMLVGYPPFDDNDIVQLVKKIKYRPVKFDGPEWVLISEEGKQFLTNLLDKDASNRMTAQQALEHDWLKNNCQAATQNALEVAQTNIKSFVNRKRWRAAIQGVKAMNRIHKMIELARDEEDEEGQLGELSAEKIEVVSVKKPNEMDNLHHDAVVRAASFSSSSSEENFINMRRNTPMTTPPKRVGRPPIMPLRYSSVDRKRSSSLVVQGVSPKPPPKVGPDNGASMVLLPLDPAFESSGEFTFSRPRGERPAAARVTYSPLAARMESSPHVGHMSSELDSGKVLRSMSRNEGVEAVVRKMSSHAKRFVRGRRAGVGSSGDKPPVMMEMGEQHRKVKKFAWPFNK